MAESSSEAQARRALASAEQRFLAGDVAGARRYARHALSLAPGLHGAEQALVAYDVHAAAPDWHAVLSLGGLHHPRPSAGDLPPAGGLGVGLTHDDVKRQHRRLCLLVHPDKNPSAAADGAFKIVQAAYDGAVAAMQAAWEEEAAVSRFWQTVADDAIVTPAAPTAPKPPPIARPPPRWAAPAPGPRGQPPSWAPGVQTPRRPPAPSNPDASRPTMSGNPYYCPYYPLCACVLCRLYATTAPMAGKPY